MRRITARLATASLLAFLAGACTAPPVIESTTRLQATTDTVGPYKVQSIVVGITDQVVELRYRPGDGAPFIPLVMTADDSGERFRAAIPGNPAGTRIGYYVAVLEDGARIAADPDGAAARPHTFTILPAEPAAGLP